MKIGENVGCNYFEIGVYCVGLTTSSLAGKRLEGGAGLTAFDLEGCQA